MSGPAGFSGAGPSNQSSHDTDKYGGLKPKNPLLNRNHDASYFDSADYQLRTISGARTGARRVSCGRLILLRNRVGVRER